MATARLSPLLVALRGQLAEAGDAERGRQQQAYMKSAMPYHGVSNAETRRISKRVFKGYDFTEAARWQEDVRAIWRDAGFREERYAAIELVLHRRARLHLTMEALPLVEEMIITGAWWDYVDLLAAHGLGQVLRNEPKPMRRAMLKWSRDEDLWKRRSSILCQLQFKAETDLDLLYTCIEPSLARKEFWLRKAIGWALRQYAWIDPAEIARWVEANDARLSPLSKREALKNEGRRRIAAEATKPQRRA